MLSPLKLAGAADGVSLLLSSTETISPSPNPPQSSVGLGDVTGDCQVDGTVDNASEGVDCPPVLPILRSRLLDPRVLGCSTGSVDNEGYETGLLNTDARSSVELAQGLSAAGAALEGCSLLGDLAAELTEGAGALSNAAINRFISHVS